MLDLFAESPTEWLRIWFVVARLSALADSHFAAPNSQFSLVSLFSNACCFELNVAYFHLAGSKIVFPPRLELNPTDGEQLWEFSNAAFVRWDEILLVRIAVDLCASRRPFKPPNAVTHSLGVYLERKLFLSWCKLADARNSANRISVIIINSNNNNNNNLLSRTMSYELCAMCCALCAVRYELRARAMRCAPWAMGYEPSSIENPCRQLTCILDWKALQKLHHSTWRALRLERFTLDENYGSHRSHLCGSY